MTSLATLPSDPALPGLQIATDQEQMLELFRRYLRPRPPNDYEITDCRLSRAHYHQGDRCSLRYTLRIVERLSGRERAQWVTGLIFAGDRAARVWNKVRATDPMQEFPQAFPAFEPLAFIPDLRMVAQVFPYDRDLPALPRLTVSPPPDLEPLFIAHFGQGDWNIEVCRVVPVHYRVRRVAVLRYELEGRTGSMTRTEKRCLYAKVYREQVQGERTYRVLQTLHESAATGRRGFTVARPLAYISNLRVLLQEEAAGVSLQQILREDGDLSAVRTAARALADFRLGRVEGLPHHRFESEVAVLRRAAHVLGLACPHLRERAEALVSAVIARLDEVAPEPTHGELKTDHIFINGDAVTVIDLDSCALSDPILDPARVLAHLSGRSLRDGTNDGGNDAAAQSFIDEYFRHVPNTGRSRLLPHYAAALLKEAVDFCRHLEPRWPEKVAVFIGEAERALSFSSRSDYRYA